MSPANNPNARARRAMKRVAADATEAEVQKTMGKAPRIRADADTLAYWDAFGAAATDRQKINIEMFDTVTNEDTFWNAAHVAQDDLTTAIAVPEGFTDEVREAAMSFLARAEAEVASFTIVLAFETRKAPQVTLHNHVSGPSVETKTIDELAPKLREPAKALAEAFETLPDSIELEASVRTFR